MRRPYVTAPASQHEPGRRACSAAVLRNEPTGRARPQPGIPRAGRLTTGRALTGLGGRRMRRPYVTRFRHVRWSSGTLALHVRRFHAPRVQRL